MPHGDVLPAGTIYECIRAAAHSRPNKTAVVHLQSAEPDAVPRTLTFAGLVESIERAANLFHAIAAISDGQSGMRISFKDLTSIEPTSHGPNLVALV